jgi:predicted outer membrane repeat protein
LLKSIVSGNTAGFNGGGINSEGTATLTGSTVSANRGASGGGVYVRGDFTVVSGTVSGNVSDSCGGGIDNDGTVSLANTTISGNTAEDCGGGIYNQTVLTVTSSTFSANAAVRGGALGSDVAEKEGATSLANTLIDGDCDSDVPLISNGYNIESPGDTCGLNEAAGDMVSVTAEQLDLGPLQDNGGVVQTHAITTDSAAFDVIPESMCQLDEDEREVTRPQGDACDVGAFELEM